MVYDVKTLYWCTCTSHMLKILNSKTEEHKVAREAEKFRE